MVDATGRKQRLLIVDDSKVIRVTARKILQDHFETVEAVDGENAWDVLNNSDPFSLVVSDLTMPNLDGFGLLKLIRSSSEPDIRDIPVIVITGANDSEPTKSAATEAGATDFIGKPFDSVHLLARTQAHADAHTANKNLTKENIDLEDQSLTDPLTALPNETAFLERGYEQVSYAIRHKTSLAIFRIEVDGYDDLHKQYDKPVTESIVKSVAGVLQSCVRQEDMAARIGPARFSLLLGGMNAAGIRTLANRINRDISSRTLKQGDTRIRYTVSIGVAAPGIRRNSRFEELLSLADSRLGFAISSGGNQVAHDDTGIAAATPDEPVTPTLLTDEVISEMINQPAEPAPPAANTVAPVHDEVPETPAAIESLAAQEPVEIPTLFAGPVPDLSASAPAGSVPADTRTTSTALPPVFTAAQGPEDDTIIITAPFDGSDPDMQINATAPDAATVPLAATDPATGMTATREDEATAGLQIPEIRMATAGEPAEDGIETPRRGLFRRLFAPFGWLFRRNR